MSSVLEKCAALPEVKLVPGTTLLIEGEKSGRLYVLIEGEIRVSHGGVEIATIAAPGSIFGEMSFLLDVPHTATVKVVSPSRAYVVDDIQSFLQSAPQMLQHIASLLALRLQCVTGYLADVKKQYAEQNDHLCMVDEVLGSLLHQQRHDLVMGPELGSDPRL